MPDAWLDAHLTGVLGKRGIDRDPEEAIRDLLVAYTTAYDAGDVQAVLKLFAEDAVYTTMLGTFVGREQLQENFEGLIARFERSAHMTTNQTIDLLSPHAARAWSYLHAIVELKGGGGYGLVASYDDYLENRDGRWCIVRHTVRDGLSYRVEPIAAADRLNQGERRA